MKWSGKQEKGSETNKGATGERAPGGEEQILIRKKELSQIVCPGFLFPAA